MKTAKRQIVLGALILALGAAVYLNWQFANVVPENDVGVTNNTQVKDEDLGIAQLVNNSYLETVTDENQNEQEVVVDLKDIISEARVEREKVRAEASEMIADILEDDNISKEDKKSAIDKSVEIAENIVNENSAEKLIKAKGIEDVIVFVNDGVCNAIIKGLENNTLIVQEILVNQIGISADKIHIIEAK